MDENGRSETPRWGELAGGIAGSVGGGAIGGALGGPVGSVLGSAVGDELATEAYDHRADIQRGLDATKRWMAQRGAELIGR